MSLFGWEWGISVEKKMGHSLTPTRWSCCAGSDDLSDDLRAGMAGGLGSVTQSQPVMRGWPPCMQQLVNQNSSSMAPVFVFKLLYSGVTWRYLSVCALVFVCRSVFSLCPKGYYYRAAFKKVGDILRHIPP